MGGVPSDVRGKFTVFVNPPLARAWWRGRLAVDVAQNSEGELNAEQAHYPLHASNAAWERLIQHSASQITVLNQARVRAALVLGDSL